MAASSTGVTSGIDTSVEVDNFSFSDVERITRGAGTAAGTTAGTTAGTATGTAAGLQKRPGKHLDLGEATSTGEATGTQHLEGIQHLEEVQQGERFSEGLQEEPQSMHIAFFSTVGTAAESGTTTGSVTGSEVNFLEGTQDQRI